MASPQISPGGKSLLQPPCHEFDDPWYDRFPSLNTSPSSRGTDLSRANYNSFHLFMRVNQFKPREIHVKLEDGFVVVQAKHEGRPKELRGFVSREFKRQYKLPDGMDPATLNSTFNENGLLIVKANRKVPETVAYDDGQAFLQSESQKPFDFDAFEKALVDGDASDSNDVQKTGN